MQVLAVVSKSTKQGLSVWRFVQTETGEYFAFGGVKPACKAFATIDDMRSCYKNWVHRYGYKPGLVSVKPVAKHVRPIPADLQADLWALQPTAA